MTLKTPAYVMLGMLRLGSKTGYEVRRAAELSLRFFWAVSPGQIYTELRRLESAGLVAGMDDPRGSLRRRAFVLTPSGHDALRDWVSAPDIGNFEWRDLGLLKLFFSDAVSVDERLRMVDGLRARADEVRRHFEEVVVPAGEKTRDRGGHGMPEVTARFGLEFWEFMRDWCDRLELELTGPAARR